MILLDGPEKAATLFRRQSVNESPPLLKIQGRANSKGPISGKRPSEHPNFQCAKRSPDFKTFSRSRLCSWHFGLLGLSSTAQEKNIELGGGGGGGGDDGARLRLTPPNRRLISITVSKPSLSSFFPVQRLGSHCPRSWMRQKESSPAAM